MSPLSNGLDTHSPPIFSKWALKPPAPSERETGNTPNLCEPVSTPSPPIRRGQSPSGSQAVQTSGVP